MTYFLALARIVFTAALIGSWALAVAAISPIVDLSTETAAMDVQMDCCPHADAARGNRAMVCDTMLTCAVQPAVNLSGQFKVAYAITWSATEWPAPATDLLARVDRSPPVHPPRS